MSREIDERIVQMKFDNTLFEKNVATSIGTLEKLKSALDFSGATNSLNNIERNVNAADFSKLSSNIEAISNRFSNWGIVGMTVIQDITRGVENLAMKILNIPISKFEQAFGLVKSGGWLRATNIDKAKFSIEGLGYAWDDLKDSIDGAVTDTRFGFDEAATAASQLVASNVAIGEEMDNALKSIANVASQTGDEYSSIAHIYTTIAGNGKLMTEQLNMFSYRGLNAAALIAKSMGKTEQEIREMTTKGEISFKQFSDAMNDALGEGAKRANDTFEGSLANMQAALKRMGQPFAEVIRKQMPPVFNDLKEFIKQIKTITDPLADVFDTIFTNATRAFRYFIKGIDLTPLKNAVETFGEFVKGVDAFLTKSSKIWGHLDKDLNGIVSPIKEATQYYTSFAESLLDKTKNITGIPTSALDAMRKVAKEAEDQYESFANSVLAKKDSLLGVPTSVFDQMKKLAGTTGKYVDEMILGDREGVFKTLQDQVASHYESVINGVSVGFATDELIDRIISLTNEGKKAEEVVSGIQSVFKNMSLEDATKAVETVQSALKPTGNLIEQTTVAIEETATSIEHVDEVAKKVLRGEYGNGQERIDKLEEEGENWKLIQNRVNELTGCAKRYEVVEEAVTTTVTKGNRKIAKVLEKRKTAMDAIGDMINSLTEKFKQLMDTVDKNGVAKKIGTIFNGLRDGVYVAIRVFSVFLNAALKPTFTFLQTIADAVLSTWARISEFISGFRAITETTDFLIELEGTLSFVFWQISNVGKVIVGLFTDIVNVVGSALSKVNGFKFIYAIVDLIGSLSEKVIEIIDDIRIHMDRDAFTDKIAAFLNGVIDGLTMIVRAASVVFNAAMKPLAGLLTTIGSTLLNCVSSLGEWFTNIKNAAKESGFFENLEAILNNIFWIISDVGQAIANLFGGAFTKAIGSINNVVTRLKATFEAFKGTDAFKGLKKSLADLRYDFNQLKIKGTELIKKIFKGFGKTKIKLPTGPFDLLLSIMTRVSEAVSKFISLVVDKFDVDKFLNGVATTVEKITPTLRTLGTVIKNTLIVAFKGAINVFKGFFEIVSKLWDKVKDLWSEFKNSKGFEGIKGVASVIGGWFGDLFDSLANGEFKLPEIDFKSLIPSLEEIKVWLGERWEGLKTWLGEKWEGLKTWFKEKWKSLFSASNEEGEESGFKLPELDTTNIEASIDRLLEWLHTKVDAIKKTLISFLTGKEYDEVSEAAAEMPDIGDFMLNDKTEDYDWDQKHPVLAFLKHLAGALLGLAGDTVIAGLDVLDRLVLLIEDHFPTISGILNDMLGGSLGIVEDFVNRINASEDAQDKIAAIRGIIVEVGKTILTLKTFKAAFGILNFFTGLGDITKSIKEAIDQFKKFMKSVTKTMKATTRALNALAILELAAAVLAMAGAFKILGSLTWDQFKVAAASIGVITAALAILFLTLNSGNTNGSTKLITTPLTYLVDALKQFGNGLNKALRRIGTAAMILSFVYAVRTIIDIVKELTNYTWADAHQGVELMTVVIGEIVGAIKALNFGNGKKTFGNQIGVAAELIALAIAIKSIANTLIKLGDVPPEKLEAAEAAINNIMWLAMKLTLLGGNDSYSTNDGKGKGPFGWHTGNKSNLKRNTKWKTILATAALIWVVGNALCKLAHCNKEKLAAASEAMAAVMETCVGVMAAAAFISDSSSGSKVSGDITRHGLGKMFLADKSNYSKKTNASKENSAFKNILATIGLLVVVSYALVRLSKCKPEKLAAASEAIAGIVNACTSLLLATTIISDKDAGKYFDGDTLFGHKKKGKYNKSNNSAWKSMLGIIGIIWVVGNAIKGLSDMDADKIEAAGNAIAKIALVCVGIIAASSFVENGEMGNVREGGLMSKIFGNVKGAKKHTTSVTSLFQSFVPVIAAVLSAAGAIYGLRDVDVATIDAAGDAVAKIALACSAIIAASGFMNFLTGDEAALNQVIGGFVAAGTIFESVLVAKDAIAGLASMDVDAEKLKVSGEALFDALAGIAVVLLGTGGLVALGALGSGSGLIVAGIMAVIGLIISLVDQFAPGGHNFLYGVEGAAEGSEEAVGYLDRLVNAFNAIGRMINGFVSGLLGTENVGDDIKQAAGDMSTGLSESISGLGDSLSGAIEEIKGINLPQMFDDMGLGEIPGKLTDFAADLKLFLAEAKGITKKDLDPLDETLKALLKIIGVEFIIDLVNTLNPNEESGVVAMLTNLNDNFFENFKTFCENAKNELDPEALTSLQKLVEVLEGVAKATFIGNLAWLIGEEGLEELAVALTDFVEQMDQYNEAIKDKNWAFGKWALVSTCCKSMIEVANMAPRTGGIYDAIFGKEDMEGFGASVLAFIGSMVDANEKLTDVSFNQDGFEAAAAAATPMNELAFALEKTGGIVQAIIGVGDLETFGQKVAAFVESMVTASGTIGDGSQFNESAFELVAKCGQYLATLETNLPPTGGKLQEWMGNKNISVFGTRVKMFIQKMTEASDILEQNPIDSEALTALADLGTMFSTLESTLEAQDGLKQWLEGQKDIGDFGYDLETFAMKMVRFSDLITGNAKNAGDVQGHSFDNQAVRTAVVTLQRLWDMVTKIQAAGLAEQGAALTGLTKGTEGFITAANWVLEFYNQIGAEILSDKNFDESQVLTSLEEAGEKLASTLTDGMKNKLEELDEKTGQSSISAMLYNAIAKAIITNNTFEKNITANGRWIGTTLIDGLKKILSEDEEGSTFPAFVNEFVTQFQDMIDRIIAAMTSSESKFRTGAEGWMKKLQEGINAYKESIIGSLKNIPIATLTFYGTQNSLFRSAGWNWMMELWDGINSGSSYVYELANSVASNVAGIIDGAVSKASAVPSGLSLMTDDFYTLGGRSLPMLNAMNTVADTGLRTATALEGAMNTASSNGQMAFQQLQSVAGIQNGAFSLSRDAGAIADTAAASMSRTASLARSASISSPVMSQVYVKDSNDTLEALNGMRRDIKALTDNMANMQMVLDSGVLVGQLTPGLDVSLSQRTRFKGRWA